MKLVLIIEIINFAAEKKQGFVMRSATQNEQTTTIEGTIPLSEDNLHIYKTQAKIDQECVHEYWLNSLAERYT